MEVHVSKHFPVASLFLTPCVHFPVIFTIKFLICKHEETSDLSDFAMSFNRPERISTVETAYSLIKIVFSFGMLHRQYIQFLSDCFVHRPLISWNFAYWASKQCDWMLLYIRGANQKYLLVCKSCHSFSSRRL